MIMIEKVVRYDRKSCSLERLGFYFTYVRASFQNCSIKVSSHCDSIERAFETSYSEIICSKLELKTKG